MEASVIQQDVGVTLYVENAPEPSPTPDASASPSPTPSKSAKEDDAENEKTPLLGVAATITLTDAKGNATDYELDTETGTALAEDVTPGDYTLAVQPIEGYTQPEAQTVTVKEKVVYKADVKAVKEKIVQASQVNESAEDSGVSNAGSAPIVNEVTDTVTYADSARTETGSKTSYTAKLSSSGHLLLADGTETPYLPVYQDGTKDLIGAMRDTSYAANTATAAWLPGPPPPRPRRRPPPKRKRLPRQQPLRKPRQRLRRKHPPRCPTRRRAGRITLRCRSWPTTALP